jgi:hypothetical protein
MTVHKQFKRFWVLSVLVGLTSSGCDRKQCTTVTMFSDRTLQTLVRRCSITNGYLYSIRPSADRNGLELHLAGPSNATILLVSSNKLSRIITPGIRSYLGEKGNSVAWTTNVESGWTFANGTTLKLPPYAAFDVDYAGNYFVVGVRPCQTYLGVVGQTNLTLLLSNAFATRIFSSSTGLIISGWKCSSAQNLNPLNTYAWTAVRHKDGFALLAENVLPGISAITDVSTDGVLYLCASGSELRPRIRVYDTRTAQYTCDISAARWVLLRTPFWRDEAAQRLLLE